MKQLVLASHNKGKLAEFRDMLGGLVEEIRSAADYHLPEPAETGTTFVENALIKSHAAMQATKLPALADDSGLSVDALSGSPGVYSADWAGIPRDFDRAMKKLHDALSGNVNGQKARFISVLTLSRPDRDDEVFEGVCEGTLVWPPRGAGGFGYDPMFVPDGHKITFSEMTEEKKNTLSHRAKAVEQLTAFLANDIVVG
ncbi:MAG: RdgB/HAM1 family non-canonical purine NTP pyrophosphatase [Alphaproteobacteria bacterium]|nr:RdgB/HAM1 family non-canonical purine NTP pyrophosphatase [Alphaproteobacteria bacterium]